MPRRIHLEPHLMVDELERRYRGAQEPHERSWFQVLWLLANRHFATIEALQARPDLIRSTTLFHR